MYVDSVHPRHGIRRAILAALINEARELDRWVHAMLVQLVVARS